MTMVLGPTVKKATQKNTAKKAPVKPAQQVSDAAPAATERETEVAQ